MTRVKDGKLCFVRFDKAWYAKSNGIVLPCIGLECMADGGGCHWECSVSWDELCGGLVPKISIFSDAWMGIPTLRPLFKAMAKMTENIAADAFCEELKKLGWEDATQYKRPKGR
jgi:hypothetical protein